MNINLWSTIELVKMMNGIVEKLSPKNDAPSIHLTPGEKIGNKTPDAEFEYNVYTLFGWLKLRATSTGQPSITSNAIVRCQIELGERPFLFFDSKGEFDWRLDFDADGFTLEFQKAVKAEVEEIIGKENN